MNKTQNQTANGRVYHDIFFESFTRPSGLNDSIFFPMAFGRVNKAWGKKEQPHDTKCFLVRLAMCQHAGAQKKNAMRPKMFFQGSRTNSARQESSWATSRRGSSFQDL
jgi:hypothetical protein